MTEAKAQNMRHASRTVFNMGIAQPLPPAWYIVRLSASLTDGFVHVACVHTACCAILAVLNRSNGHISRSEMDASAYSGPGHSQKDACMLGRSAMAFGRSEGKVCGKDPLFVVVGAERAERS